MSLAARRQAGPLVPMRSRCAENGGTCWQTGRRVDGGQCEQCLRIGPCKKIGSCKKNLCFMCFGTVSSSYSCPEHSFPCIAAGSAVWVLFADAAVSVDTGCVVTWCCNVWNLNFKPLFGAVDRRYMLPWNCLQSPNTRIFYDPPDMIAWIHHGCD